MRHLGKTVLKVPGTLGNQNHECQKGRALDTEKLNIVVPEEVKSVHIVTLDFYTLEFHGLISIVYVTVKDKINNKYKIKAFSIAHGRK